MPLKSAVCLSSLICSYVTNPIPDKTMPDLLSIKVGRSNNVNRRLGEWERQCPSKELIFRGYWPSTRPDVEDAADFNKGTLYPTAKGKNVRRLERYCYLTLTTSCIQLGFCFRLIHLHLADLVMFTQYTHAQFPNVSFENVFGNDSGSSMDGDDGSTRSKARRPSGSRTPLDIMQSNNTECEDCTCRFPSIW